METAVGVLEGFWVTGVLVGESVARSVGGLVGLGVAGVLVGTTVGAAVLVVAAVLGFKVGGGATGAILVGELVVVTVAIIVGKAVGETVLVLVGAAVGAVVLVDGQSVSTAGDGGAASPPPPFSKLDVFFAVCRV